MIYDNHFKCIIGKEESTYTTEIEGKKLIDNVVTEVKEKIYWTSTPRKNGVAIEFEVKKHNKQQFINAVKDQLMYFKNSLDFVRIEKDGNKFSDNVFARILLDEEKFLISDNPRFTVPHILINNVNYGNVNAPELGINKLLGNIAIKGNASDVDVTASRESVKWTEKTKSYVLKAINDASFAAGEALKEELSKIKNPIERYISANTPEWLSHASGDKEKIIKELKKFGGEVKTNVTIPITDIYDAKQRKALGLPEYIQVNKMLMYVMDHIKVIQLDVRDNRIIASKVESIGTLKFNMDSLFLITETSKAIRTSEAMYWGKYHSRKFQYIQYKIPSLEPPNKPMLNSLENQKLYKMKLKYFYLHKAMLIVFSNLLKKYCTDIEKLDREKIANFITEYRLTDDAAIMVKDSQDNMTTYAKVKSEAVKRDEELKLLKKRKELLPYKFALVKVEKTGQELLQKCAWDSDISYRTAVIKAVDLLEVDSIVYYASNKDKMLLGMAAIPNAMDIKEFFKGEHSIVNNELVLKGGDNIRQFLTSYKVQEVILSQPEFLILVKGGTHVYNKFLTYFDDDSEEKVLFMQIRKAVHEFPINSSPLSQDDFRIKVNQYFSDVLTADFSNIESLFGLLNNMIKLQDIPDIEDLEDEELIKQVKPFKSYAVSFYDKKFVNDARLFMNKYSRLFIYCAMLEAIKDSSDFNSASTITATKLVEERITEFFNNLNK